MSKIVLMGDSITEYMPYIYKGIIGSTKDEVNYYGVENIGVGNYMNYIWPRVAKTQADVYILLIGVNNIFRPDCDYDEKETIEDLITKIKEFIYKIANNSSAKLIVQSIYPTKYPKVNKDIIYVNENIENYCTTSGVEYLDIHSLLTTEAGLFDKKYSNNGIHPNELGYNIIANEINKKLKNNYTKTKKYSY